MGGKAARRQGGKAAREHHHPTPSGTQPHPRARRTPTPRYVYTPRPTFLVADPVTVVHDDDRFVSQMHLRICAAEPVPVARDHQPLTAPLLR
ncbi:hypothetical protein BN1708_004923 [Verticillium longisporum]|uniref:Uncharacterized protein n=1 Tax=Verticillium longisporum TaxID=100787 RepID=A0A0G4M4V3_VERLO|nr:hypothetical protein BN1708_004923 [Verticillium longisporum]